jgi:hypothetical protein
LVECSKLLRVSVNGEPAAFLRSLDPGNDTWCFIFDEPATNGAGWATDTASDFSSRHIWTLLAKLDCFSILGYRLPAAIRLISVC